MQSNQSPVISSQSADIPLSPAAIDAVLATVELVNDPKKATESNPWSASSPAARFRHFGRDHAEALEMFRRSLPFQWQFIDWSRIAA